MIVIVDYGMGNMRSVSKAVEHLGYEVCVTNKPYDVSNAQGLIVPGVGAFGDCLDNLTAQNLLDPIKTYIESERPYLGICLGMHILFQGSEEDHTHKGLGIFPGMVTKFPIGPKVPHMGWNTIDIEKQDPLFKDIDSNSYTYFVHSYYVPIIDKGIIGSSTTYGDTTFCSAVCCGSIFATQFHPEKSQIIGLKILDNFCILTKK